VTIKKKAIRSTFLWYCLLRFNNFDARAQNVEMKATELYFRAVLFVTLHKVDLAFKSLDN